MSSASDPFTPAFRTDVVGTSAYGGSWHLNPIYFATPETATAMVARFGLMGWFENPPASWGAFTISAGEIVLMLTPTLTYNCGLLAEYFVLSPQDPARADALVREAIANLESRGH